MVALPFVGAMQQHFNANVLPHLCAYVVWSVRDLIRGVQPLMGIQQGILHCSHPCLVVACGWPNLAQRGMRARRCASPAGEGVLVSQCCAPSCAHWAAAWSALACAAAAACAL